MKYEQDPYTGKMRPVVDMTPAQISAFEQINGL
jgi:hypothetical protein